VDFAQVTGQISLLLQSHPDGTRQALELVDRYFRRHVAATVRKQYPLMSPEDLADVYQEAFLSFCEKAVSGQIDPQKSFFSLLCTIALRRAADRERRKTAEHKALSEVLGEVARALQGTGVGRHWAALGAAERKEVMQFVRDVTDSLPPRQKLVMRSFERGYPETECMEVLRQEVARETGNEETLGSVKRALQEARQKIRDFLRTKGYDFGGGEES
jgi:RNA polymerase sigma factor (sigma-70 family)